MGTTNHLLYAGGVQAIRYTICTAFSVLETRVVVVN